MKLFLSHRGEEKVRDTRVEKERIGIKGGKERVGGREGRERERERERGRERERERGR